jgi:cytosine/adenosine deaminase-related metal-dependent hydrolase
MFTEMAVTYLLHKSHQGNPQAMGGYTVMDMAFDNNAEIAKIFFPKPVAALEAGAYADIILLDYYPFTEMTDGNFPWHILFGMDGSRVTHTIASGKMLMKDRQLLHLDEQAIAAHAKKLSGKVWDRVLEL